MIGVKKDEDEGEVIIAGLDDGTRVEIAPYTWELFRLALKDGELTSEVVGSFTQYPVRLAFAVTIHKSQGKTFERAVIDVGRAPSPTARCMWPCPGARHWKASCSRSRYGKATS